MLLKWIGILMSYTMLVIMIWVFHFVWWQAVVSFIVIRVCMGWEYEIVKFPKKP